MKVGIIGAGAIGCVLGSELAALGHEVTYAVRTPFHQVIVEGPIISRQANVRCVETPDQATTFDAVVLAVKAHQVAGASAWLDAWTRSTTPLLVAQNGVEHVERTAPFTPSKIIVPTILECPTERLGVGHVRLRAKPEVTMRDDDGGRFGAELFTSRCQTHSSHPGKKCLTPIAIVLTDDFTTMAWRKLCRTAATGAIMALTGQTARVFAKPGVFDLARELTREAVTVARAAGARLDADEEERILAEIASLRPDKGTSMLTDRLAGRPLESDARNGAIVRFADRLGIAAPLNRALAAILATL